MKRTMNIFLMGFIMFASCQKFEPSSRQFPEAEGEYMFLEACMPGHDETVTRVAYDDEDMSLVWESGDQLMVIGVGKKGGILKTQTPVTFTLIEGANSVDGVFKSDRKLYYKGDRLINSAASYIVTYKTEQIAYERTEADIEFSYYGQTTRPESLRKYLYLRSDPISQEDLMKSKFKLKMCNSIFRFSLESRPEGLDLNKVKKVVWENGKTNIPMIVYTKGACPEKILISFDPARMKLSPSDQISLSFFYNEGNFKKFRVSATSRGKSYLSGGRYSAPVNAAGGRGLSIWDTADTPGSGIIDPKNIPSSQILINGTPGFLSGFTVPAGYTLTKDTESDYYILEKKNGAITTTPQIPAYATEVILPESVTHISSNTFRDCKQLHSVVLNEGLKTIGSNAFENCNNLKEVDIPEGVVTLGPSAFKNCSSLKSLHLPESLEQIENEALLGTALSEIKVPDNVRLIGWRAMAENPNLTNIEFSENSKLQEIHNGAFSDNKSLVQLSIPATVKKLGLEEGCILDNCLAFRKLVIKIPVDANPQISETLLTQSLKYIGDRKTSATDIDLYIHHSWQHHKLGPNGLGQWHSKNLTRNEPWKSITYIHWDESQQKWLDEADRPI